MLRMLNSDKTNGTFKKLDILSGSGSAQHHLTIAFIPIANFKCEKIGADVILRI